MSDEDKQIEIKKRARRRLVGAAALALLAVIVLPMVMDSDRRPVEHDIEIKIPPQSGDNSVAKVIEPAAVHSPVVEPVPTQPAAEVAARDAVVAPAAKPSPEPVPERAPARPPSDEGLRAAAILAGKSPDALPGKIEQFVVQLGAYRDRGNAVSLQNKLKSDGFSSYTEKVGDKTRVRIGPFPERAGAEAALARVKRLGLSGTVMPRD